MIEPAAAIEPTAEQVVYFIGGREGPVKIGFTNNVTKRLALLQTGNPTKLLVLATTPGGRGLELEYHFKFMRLRVSLAGEWFHRGEALLAELRRLNSEFDAMTEATQFKITDPAEMRIDKQPAITTHPGVFLRETILPQFGLTKVAPLAAMLHVARPNLSNVLHGNARLTRDMAYRFGALLGDELCDFLLSYKLKWDLQEERPLREAYRRTIKRLNAPASRLA